MPLMPAPFWFLRHGETDHNAAGLSHGALDAPLNATGRAQATAAAPLLAGQGITAIVSSPMLRAAETADIINEFLNLPIRYEADLREVVFPGMEGKPLMPWFPEWLEGRHTPKGAESFQAVTARTTKAMNRVLASPGPVLIVAHGGIFRALRDLMGLAKENLTANAVPLYCQPTDVGWEVRPPPAL
jgi:broad specificity phosphatase PhoE